MVSTHAFLLHAYLLDILIELELIPELCNLSLTIEFVLSEVNLTNLLEYLEELGDEGDSRVFQIALTEL